MKTKDKILCLIERWACCDLGTVSIGELPEHERLFFATFMPQARTAIALGHHVTTEEEWTWYATGLGVERCAADDHTKELCEQIQKLLVQEGYETRIVDYPGESGLQFRYVAQSAGLGVIGTNTFLFHPVWGPWIHLRVMATTAKLDIHPKLAGDEFCNQCDSCITECPAGAISNDGFEGLTCRSYRKARGEYEPYGPKGEYQYCLRCIWICPQGEQPNRRQTDEDSVEQPRATDKPHRSG